MNIGDELDKLSQDISACQKDIANVYSSIKNPSGAVSESSEYVMKANCKPRQGGTKAPTAYHKHCVPEYYKQSVPLKKMVGRPPRKRIVSQKEHFTTKNAAVEVMIKSCPKSTPGRLHHFKKNDFEEEGLPPKKATKPEKKEALLKEDDKWEPKIPPKKKTSWGNILREQNKMIFDSYNTLEQKFVKNVDETDLRYLSHRPNSCDEHLLGVLVSEKAQVASKATREPNENAIFQDKSVQCSKTQSVCSKTPNASNMFSMYNPVRTLQFLMSEFQSRLKKIEGDDFTSLMQDMENALQRISEESISEFPPKQTNLNTMPTPSLQSEEISNSSKERTVSSNSNQVYQPSTNFAPNKDKVLEAERSKTKLEKRLEESVLKLEETCQQMERTCSRLREERDQLIKQISDRERKLELAVVRERDYETRLSEYSKLMSSFSSKGDHYSQSLKSLTEMLGKLQEENKVIPSLKEVQKETNLRMQEAVRENDRLTREIQLMQLEREKNTVLLRMKDQELKKLRSDIESLGGLVSCELKRVTVVPSSSSDFETSTLISSLMIRPPIGGKGDEVLVTSSPNTSGSTSSPPPYKSWQRMSSISVPPKKEKKITSVETTEPRQHSPSAYPRLPRDGKRLAAKGQPLESIKTLKTQLKELFTEMRSVQPYIAGDEGKVWSDVTSLATLSLTSSSDRN